MCSCEAIVALLYIGKTKKPVEIQVEGSLSIHGTVLSTNKHPVSVCVLSILTVTVSYCFKLTLESNRLTFCSLYLSILVNNFSPRDVVYVTD